MQLHHLIDLAKNEYDENVTRLMGMAAGSAVKRTRLDGWVLHRKAANTPAESTEEVLSEQNEAGFGERSEVPSSCVSCAPWSSGNHCTIHRFLAE
ncbi:hypothetical protein [Aeromonas hydrophila]|uniref:hypothetical protein n=1 Tax=Aeromonas hydrophila TaxID=644 RepID=UPI001A8F91A8|nr:hypothetical protein [Aeromonas hydrophila]